MAGQEHLYSPYTTIETGLRAQAGARRSYESSGSNIPFSDMMSPLESLYAIGAGIGSTLERHANSPSYSARCALCPTSPQTTHGFVFTPTARRLGSRLWKYGQTASTFTAPTATVWSTHHPLGTVPSAVMQETRTPSSGSARTKPSSRRKRCTRGVARTMARSLLTLKRGAGSLKANLLMMQRCTHKRLSYIEPS